MNGLEVRSNLSNFKVQYLLLYAVAWKQKALCTLILWLGELLPNGMCTQNSEDTPERAVGLSK